MKKPRPKIAYDKESEVLSIQIGKGKSTDSDIQNNAVIDYNEKGEIVRVNLYKFSFSDFTENLPTLKTFKRRQPQTTFAY